MNQLILALALASLMAVVQTNFTTRMARAPIQVNIAAAPKRASNVAKNHVRTVVQKAASKVLPIPVGTAAPKSASTEMAIQENSTADLDYAEDPTNEYMYNGFETSDHEATVADAISHCENNDMKLAELNDMTTQFNFIGFLVERDRTKHKYWIGGIQSGESWMWWSGRRISFQYWANGQPERSRSDKNCIATINPFMKWEAKDCTKKLHFVCQEIQN